MAKRSTVLAAVKKAVKARKTEQGEVNAVARTLALYGYLKKPEIFEAGTPQGEIVRVYVYDDDACPAGPIMITAGPSIVGEVEKLDAERAKDLEAAGIYLQGSKATGKTASKIKSSMARQAAKADVGSRKPPRKTRKRKSSRKSRPAAPRRGVPRTGSMGFDAPSIEYVFDLEPFTGKKEEVSVTPAGHALMLALCTQPMGKAHRDTLEQMLGKSSQSIGRTAATLAKDKMIKRSSDKLVYALTDDGQVYCDAHNTGQVQAPPSHEDAAAAVARWPGGAAFYEAEVVQAPLPARRGSFPQGPGVGALPASALASIRPPAPPPAAEPSAADLMAAFRAAAADVIGGL